MRQFKAELMRQAKAVGGAAETAVKVEAYRLMLLMRKELREGKAGTTTLAPLSNIARYGRRNPQPLAPLARNAVRYMAIGRGAHLQVSIGFLYSTSRKAGIGRTSDSWIKIAERLQAGFTTPADSPSVSGITTLRQSFIRRGSRLGKRSRLRRFFFLRKQTRLLTTPARNVIEPFWAAHEREAERNIINNFKRKLAGERI
jgi:hypothetical protein